MSGPLISDDYRALNRELHARDIGYGSGGHKHVIRVRGFADALVAKTILDYGCGTGTLKAALGTNCNEYFPTPYLGVVYEYDPAIKAKAKNPKKRDLVVCTDVLEHIEPENIDAVLDHICGLSLMGAFLSIATRASNKVLSDGRNAHLIVEGPEWWGRKIMARKWDLHMAVEAKRWGTDDVTGIMFWMVKEGR